MDRQSRPWSTWYLSRLSCPSLIWSLYVILLAMTCTIIVFKYFYLADVMMVFENYSGAFVLQYVVYNAWADCLACRVHHVYALRPMWLQGTAFAIQFSLASGSDKDILHVSKTLSLEHVGGIVLHKPHFSFNLIIALNEGFGALLLIQRNGGSTSRPKLASSMRSFTPIGKGECKRTWISNYSKTDKNPVPSHILISL